MGRFAAIGGGTYEEIDPLAKKIAEMSGKEIPNVLFIGTALEDSTNPLTSCKKTFKRVCPGCIVKKLSLIRSVYTDEEIDGLLSWADVIFVGGGNTAFMLKTWEKFGLKEKLKKVFTDDTAVLSGVSAGAICWFTKGYTDSEMFEGKEDWQYVWITPGIGLYDAAFCPHFNDWKRSGFEEAYRNLEDAPGEAIALDDGTMFYVNGDETGFLSAVPGMNAHRFSKA